MVDVLEYFHYREYLLDYYEFRKRSDPGFSHRTFLAAAKISGSVYLHRVLNNQRKLTEKFIPNFVSALGLKGSRAEYFACMVRFCNARGGCDKERELRHMMIIRNTRDLLALEDRKLRFFEKWYYPIVRELVTFVDFQGNYNLLSSYVIPRITAVQARGAVEYLAKNGFIRREDSGRYVQTSPSVTFGDEVNSTVLRGYHRKTLEQCAQALDTVPKQDRDISSLTLGVSRETYFEMKREIQAFRKRLLAMAQADVNPEMVCFAGFQLLPRTPLRKLGKGGAT